MVRMRVWSTTELFDHALHQVLFDVYVLSLVIVNTLSQPRRRDSEIFAHLRRDGILTFVVSWM